MYFWKKFYMKKQKNQITTKVLLIKDRVDFYKDFVYNLIEYIFDYYLDKESLYKDIDIKNHFKFCYNKTCDDFIKEGIDFKENEELIDYFYTYFYYQFYTATDQEQKSRKFFEDFWKDVFDVYNQRNNNVLNLLVEIYGIFDNSIAGSEKVF